MNQNDPIANLGTDRLQSFSDGVIAIIITIMVLELKAPNEPSLRGLLAVAPVFFSYVLSFVLLILMWVAHHYLLHPIRLVDRPLLWANSNLLFWMSLILFATAYLGQNPVEPFAVALYSVVLACVIGSFALLRQVVFRQLVHNQDLARHHAAIQLQNLIATAEYLLAVPLAYVSLYLSYAIFVMIPLFYIMPGYWRTKRH
ncbi:Uncharacterized membrane protein [Nitrosomonas sp. Nm33]|nr:Uncharacterized membrane protein [Nitrosomonas sp. Nm33]